MKLYHGSDTVIENIDLNLCKPYKDFGKGFYLSADYDQAYELAKTRTILSDRPPIVNEFEFDETLLKDPEFDVKIFDGYSEEWAHFVLDNREGKATKIYDIVYGPIANDKVGMQIRLLRGQYINHREFMERLKYMKGITFQYFFGSIKAIETLQKI